VLLQTPGSQLARVLAAHAEKSGEGAAPTSGDAAPAGDAA